MGGTPSRSNPEYFGGNIIWLTPTEIPKNTIVRINNSKEKITDLGLKKSSARIIPKESVLLTSRASIGYVAIAGDEVTTNQGFASFICHKPLLNYYLAHWLVGNKKNIELEATGTTFKEISKSKLREMLIPLPPLKEQKRIAAKIEELFSIIDGVERVLKMTERHFNRFKLSIQASSVPKIFVDFLIQTAFDLANFDVLRKQCEEKLPTGWELKEIADICDLVTDGSHQTPPRLKSGKLMLSARNVRDGHISMNEISYVSEDHFNREIKRCQPQKNDILLVSVGATIGRAAIVRNEPPFMIVRSVALLRPSEKINPLYLLKWIQNPYVQKIIKRMVHDTARGGLYLNKINRIPILLPSIMVQNNIITDLESKNSDMVSYEKSIAMLHDLIPRLKKTILKLAFEGKLIPQDPNDEPVEILLQKIKQEKEKLQEIQKISKVKSFKSRRIKNAK